MCAGCQQTGVASTLTRAGWKSSTTTSLDFAARHQLMHIRLGHLSRPQFYKGDRFHFACNIVVNSSLIRYDFTDDKLPESARSTMRLFYPKVEGCELTPYEAFQMTPLDPSTLSDAQRAISCWIQMSGGIGRRPHRGWGPDSQPG